LQCPSLGVLAKFFISKKYYEEWNETDVYKVVVLTDLLRKHPELAGYLHVLNAYLGGWHHGSLRPAIDFLSQRAFFGLKKIESSLWRYRFPRRKGINPERRRGYSDHGTYVPKHSKDVDSDWKSLSRATPYVTTTTRVLECGWILEERAFSGKPQMVNGVRDHATTAKPRRARVIRGSYK